MKALLPEVYLQKWRLTYLNKNELQELRLRIGKPLILTYQGKEIIWKMGDDPIIITKIDLERIFEWLCGYGVYAYQEEMKKGYITIQGGHRVGIGGQVSTSGDGQVIGIKYISSILIRVSHDIHGIAKMILKDIYENGRIQNILILSPPGCGKTTLLRDLIRTVSNGNAYGEGLNVSVIDERDELSAAYMGLPTLDLGNRTDVILGCDKAKGMEICLRALGPNVVAVDEIYNEKDFSSMKRLKGCGCSIIATHHASDYEEFSHKAFGMKLIREGIFDRYIVLGKEQGEFVVKNIVKSEDMG